MMKAKWLIELEDSPDNLPLYLSNRDNNKMAWWSADHSLAMLFDEECQADAYALAHLSDGVKVTLQ